MSYLIIVISTFIDKYNNKESNMDFNYTSSGGITLSGNNIAYVDYICNPKVGSLITGCFAASLTLSIDTEYSIGDIVFNRLKSCKGSFEKLAIKSILLNRDKYGFATILYKDSLNGLWEERELASQDEAVSCALDYYQDLLYRTINSTLCTKGQLISQIKTAIETLIFTERPELAVKRSTIFTTISQCPPTLGKLPYLSNTSFIINSQTQTTVKETIIVKETVSVKQYKVTTQQYLLGILDGVNPIFNLPENYIEGSLSVYLNGLNTRCFNEVSDISFQFEDPPEPDDIIIVRYLAK